MSFLLGLRMVNYIATFEEDVYDVVNSNLGDMDNDGWNDDEDGPLPIGIL